MSALFANTKCHKQDCAAFVFLFHMQAEYVGTIKDVVLLPVVLSFQLSRLVKMIFVDRSLNGSCRNWWEISLMTNRSLFMI